MELAIILLCAWGASLAGMYFYAGDAKVESYVQKEAAAQAKIDAQAHTIIVQANDEIVHMDAAFQAGVDSAKKVGATITARGAQIAKTVPAFSNLACDAGAEFVQLVNYSGANMRTAANPDFKPSAMPAAGTDPGRQAENASGSVARGPQSQGTVGGVHPKPRPVDRAGAVPR